jgi:hypothetical protein
VNGSGFLSSAAVEWNGSSLTTNVVSNTQVTAFVPAQDIATATTASITVLNTNPDGVPSNVEFFTVSEPVTTPTFTIDTPTFGDVIPTGYGLAVDLTGNGNLDWVGAGTSEQEIVLLGNGNGSFQSPVAYSISDTPSGYVVVGDFNGDGKLDFALSGAAVLVFLGKGDGSFESPINTALTNFSTFVAAGDINGDGKLDLVVAESNGSNNQSVVSVLLGNGDGTFQPQVDYPINAPTIDGLVLGDLNGDGSIDIVCATEFTPDDAHFSVLLGFGDGSFANPIQVPMTYGASGLMAADFNGDGKLDLVTSVDSITGAISVFLGNGDGTFQDGVITLTGGQTDTGLVAGDFNADGKLDLAVNTSDPAITLLLGVGDGTFPSGVDYSLSAGFSLEAAGDFNGAAHWISQDSKQNLSASPCCCRPRLALLLYLLAELGQQISRPYA